MAINRTTFKSTTEITLAEIFEARTEIEEIFRNFQKFSEIEEILQFKLVKQDTFIFL